MFAIIFIIIVLELVASMGAFGALAAQNLFTNSAAGWYIRLDWTAVFAYAVTLLSTLVTLSLAIAALARNASRSGRTCNVFFSPGSLFVLGFLFSVLWVVIAGFAYRNPLPMRYPCDIFRHLRGRLEMLGLASGKSLIEEGGLLVGICQSSKAFLALAGIGLGLWILLFVLSCASMVTGLNPPKKAHATPSSSKSLRSYISGLSQRRNAAKDPQLSASYMESGNAKLPPTHPPPAVPHGHSGHTNVYTASPTRDVQGKYMTVAPTTRCLKCSNAGPSTGQRKASGRYGNYIQHNHQPSATSGHPISKTPQLATSPPNPAIIDRRRYGTTREPVHEPASLPDPMSAFVTDGYSHDVSPRNTAMANGSPARIQAAYGPQRRAIEEPDHADSASAIDDSQNMPSANNVIGSVNEFASRPHYSTNDAHEYTDGYAPHHQENQYRQCIHSDIDRSPPGSQGSRKQRLRQLFGKEADA